MSRCCCKYRVSQQPAAAPLPVDIGETVGVVRADGNLHHDAGAIVY